MHFYRPSNKFKSLFETDLGRQLEEILTQPEVIFILVSAGISGRPPAEFVAQNLLENLGEAPFSDGNENKDQIKQMIGEMILQLMVSFGFEKLKKLAIKENPIFSSGTSYQRTRGPIKDFELFDRIFTNTAAIPQQNSTNSNNVRHNMEDYANIVDLFRQVGRDELVERGILQPKGDRFLLQRGSREPLQKLVVEHGFQGVKYKDGKLWWLSVDDRVLNAFGGVRTPKKVEDLKHGGVVFDASNDKINCYYIQGQEQSPLSGSLNHPKGQSAPPKSPFVADELLKLAQLKAQGLLTDGEYETQKRKLLNF